MQPRTEDTIGGFNSLLEKQKEEEGKCLVSTVLFNDSLRTLHDRLELKDVPEMTKKDYAAGGCTALMDAIGETIERIDLIHHYARPEDVPAHTMLIIMTDGLENASRRYSAEGVRRTVEAHKEKGWEIIFIGANIDAVETAGDFGVDADHAVDYVCDEKGTKLSFMAINKAVDSVRKKGSVDVFACMAEVRDDHAARGK